MSDTVFDIFFLLLAGIVPGLIASINNRTLQKSRSPVSFVGATLLYLISGPFWLFYMILTVPINFLIKLHYWSAAYWGNDKKEMFEKVRNVSFLNTNLDDFIDSPTKFVYSMFSASTMWVFFCLSKSTEFVNFFRNIVSTIGQFLVQTVS